MKVLYIDAFSGLSGDKFVSALLGITDAFSDCEMLFKGTSIENEIALEWGEKSISGVVCNTFKVKELVHQHVHRHLSHVEAIIDEIKMEKKAKDLAKRIFTRIAEAEARVHGTSIEKVHFHEVGALDSIADIVCAAFLITRIGAEQIISSSVAIGSGFIETQHGLLPVPAPATQELLQGVPTEMTSEKTEITTPTGAAIIREISNSFDKPKGIIPQKIGYGAGTRKLTIPNFLRIIEGELTRDQPQKEILTIETNIDDSTPENMGYVMDKLFEVGARDVYFVPVQMKKNRPGCKLAVICREEDFSAISKVIFEETSTFGIRYSIWQREELERGFREIDVEGIKIKLKQGFRSGKMIRETIEYESLRLFAREKKISLIEAEIICRKAING